MRLIHLILILIFINCQKKKNFHKVIEVDTSLKERCYIFLDKENDTLEFKRTIKILNNTLTDTIVLGGGVVLPKYVGDFNHTQFRDSKDIILDLRYDNPPANRICVSRYRNRIAKGTLKIELIESIR